MTQASLAQAIWGRTQTPSMPWRLGMGAGVGCGIPGAWQPRPHPALLGRCREWVVPGQAEPHGLSPGMWTSFCGCWKILNTEGSGVQKRPPWLGL